NIDFLLQACRQVARTFKHNILFDTYFSALALVVLQYWACVNGRFLVKDTMKTNPSAAYDRRYPETLLMIFPRYDKTSDWDDEIKLRKKKKSSRDDSKDDDVDNNN